MYRLRPSRIIWLWLALATLVWATPARADICSAYATLPDREARQLALSFAGEGNMPRLLDKLEQIDTCAILQQIDAQLDLSFPSQRRLHAAILVVATVGRGVSVDAPEAIAVASALAREFRFRSDREALLGYIALELAEKPVNEPLVALVDGLIPDRAESAIAAAAPGVIVAGSWTPPGGQPIPFYIGRQAHEAIGHYYSTAHENEPVRLNDQPISFLLREFANRGVGPASNLRVQAKGQLALRPDITNLDTHEIYEIKPAGLEDEAAARVAAYIASFASKGITVTAGRPDAPGTTGVVAAPAGHFRFHASRPGVISYQYRRGDYQPALAAAPAPQTDTVDTAVTDHTRALVTAQPVHIGRSPVEDYWDHMAATTGLSGAALLAYIILSEGSRTFPPRNAVPIP